MATGSEAYFEVLPPGPSDISLGGFGIPEIAQIKISIMEIEPAIWRRLLVSTKTTLAELHQLIQTVFGWQNRHLHVYEIGGLLFGPEELNVGNTKDDLRHIPETSIRLVDFTPKAPAFVYLYDFGDDWRHEIEIEQFLRAEQGKEYPVCVDGARACPPEDVGGVTGYLELLETLSDSSNPNYAEMRRWVGRGYDPETFDLAKTDAAIRSLSRPAKRRRPKAQSGQA